MTDLDRLKAENDDLKQQLTYRLAELNTLNAQIALYRAAIREADIEIIHLQRTLNRVGEQARLPEFK